MVLIAVLVALVLLLLAAAAMLRSSDISAILAGNLSFQRDLTNQAERGFSASRHLMESGALATDASREKTVLAANYSAARLPTNGSGIPVVLTSDSAFDDKAFTADDISENGVTVRYVIDRQCLNEGAFDTSHCEAVTSKKDASGSSWLQKPSGEVRPVYRISVRVSGPRNTQAFYQSTFSF